VAQSTTGCLLTPFLVHLEAGTLPLCHPGAQSCRVCCRLKALLPENFATHVWSLKKLAGKSVAM
jgi:hypothetical protein